MKIEVVQILTPRDRTRDAEARWCKYMYENIDDTNFEAHSISYLEEIGIPSLEVHEWRSKFTNFCLEFNISKNSIQIMTVEQFDSMHYVVPKALSQRWDS